MCVCVCILKYFNFHFVIHFIIQKTHWLLYWAQLAGVIGRCGSAGQPVWERRGLGLPRAGPGQLHSKQTHPALRTKPPTGEYLVPLPKCVSERVVNAKRKRKRRRETAGETGAEQQSEQGLGPGRSCDCPCRHQEAGLGGTVADGGPAAQ